MKNLLKKLKLPDDLKDLSYIELEQLAKEIREFIISSVTETGGHLAPSLGAVEIAIALHKIFESPKDKIIWDVGHQAYPHKILTGRKDRFNRSFRKFGGMSGFLKASESDHDSFDAGHTSTSLSAAMGIATARDIKNEKFNIAAVIGDGALTAGMAFEALNHIGSTKKKIIVILNDNGMSISKNVGALSNYLYKLRLQPFYFKIRNDIEYLLNRIPAIGTKMVKAIGRVKTGVKHLIIPGALFEELGFTYFGPVDGHNIKNLAETIEQAKTRKKPCIIHALTIKGKGYKPAEDSPRKYHGVSGIEPKKEKNIKKITYTSIFSDTICKIAEKDNKVCGITAAMPDGTGLSEFSEKFSKRFFDVGICEQHAVTFSAGLAKSGMKPYTAIYSTFLQRAYDQIVHDVCLQNLPVKFIIDRGGLVGEDGPTHHGVFDISYLSHIPNIVICAPANKNELRDMIYFMNKYNSGPIAIRYPRGQVHECEEKEIENIKLGKFQIVKKGKDKAVIVIGTMLYHVMKALMKLDSELTVINARFVKPLDKELLIEVFKDHDCIITVEENSVLGGFGSLVTQFLHLEGFHNKRIVNIGIEDEFVPHGTIPQLLSHCGLNADKLAKRIKDA